MSRLITFRVVTASPEERVRWSVRADAIVDCLECVELGTCLVRTRAQAYGVIATLEEIHAALRSWRRHVEIVPSGEQVRAAVKAQRAAREKAKLTPNPLKQAMRNALGVKEAEH